MDNEAKIKHLIEIIKRYDGYTNSCNAKAAIILSYCMACTAGISFKAIDILSKSCKEDQYILIILSLTSISAILITLAASKKAYEAVYPKLDSGNSPYEKKSLIFFGDVSNLTGGREAYKKFWKDLSSNELLEDYSQQAYIMAKITNTKFSILSECISILIKYQIPAVFISLIILALSSAAIS